jgi:hypothetical protein
MPLGEYLSKFPVAQVAKPLNKRFVSARRRQNCFHQRQAEQAPKTDECGRQFLALLEQVAVDLLVDVRSITRSRTNPQFNADALPETLTVAGISYRHLPTLGGLRHRKTDSEIT